VQFPNAPLLIAMAGLLVAALATGYVHDYARATFFAAVAVWAWLELTAGVNWPHRVLGAAGLVFVVAMVGQAFGA
jgi:ABC-type enterochelin transport system permease subunit